MFIDLHADRRTDGRRWGVEPICAALDVAVSTYYSAATLDAAETRWLEFTDTWGTKYPAVVGVWERAWEQFIPFLAFPAELRRLMYTTNSIESLKTRFRQAVRRRGHFPTEQSALKVLYLCVKRKEKNRSNPTSKVVAWTQILNTLIVTYGDRITRAIK